MREPATPNVLCIFTLCQVAAGGNSYPTDFRFIPKDPRKSLVYATHFL